MNDKGLNFFINDKLIITGMNDTFTIFIYIFYNGIERGRILCNKDKNTYIYERKQKQQIQQIIEKLNYIKEKTLLYFTKKKGL